jgi:hypothetical protein
MRLLCCIVFLFLSLIGMSQDIYVKVKKGSATFDNEVLTPDKGVRKLTEKSRITVGSNSLVLVKQNKKLLELKEAKVFKAGQIIQLLNKQKELSSSSYANVLFVEPMQKNAPPIRHGAATRGGDGINWHEIQYLPPSGMTMLSDTFRIHILNEGLLPADSLTLIGVNIKYSKKYPTSINGHFIDLGTLTPGEYEWNLQVGLNDEQNRKEEHIIKGRIIVPEAEELVQMKKEETEFIALISNFDAEIRYTLLQEFYNEKNWYP